MDVIIDLESRSAVDLRTVPAAKYAEHPSTALLCVCWQVVGEPRIVGDGNVWVAMMPLRYGDEIFHYVGILELEDGRIRRGTGYFSAPFPPQDYRAEFADRG